MRSIICAGRLGDLFQLLGCFTPDGSLLAARWVTARRACLQSISRNNAGNEIENCSRRFAAVATNLSTGRELWFTEGDLHLAIRASCSIPGLMAPVAHNGYWLVDGAVVNPIPISLTRALGADIVIAVDLQHDAHLMQQDLLSFNVSEENSENGDSLPWHARLKERLGSITTRRAVTAPTATEIMTTSIQVLENRLKRNRMAGDPPDILIQPVCPQISTLDFHRAHAAIAAGQLAVEKKMDELCRWYAPTFDQNFYLHLS